jgi:hypothetical protein
MTKDEALKMAMKDHEEIMMHAGILYPREFGKSFLKTYEAMKEALEQPAQEPVAWIKDWADGSKELVPNNYDGSYPVYTHPHQWQGLTEDEIHEQIENASIPQYQGMDVTATNLITFARAIEQASKEKNT